MRQDELYERNTREARYFRQICLALFPKLALLLVFVCASGVYAAEPTARQLYKQGRKLEKQKDFARAYILYAEAAAKDPSHKEYWIRAQALRTRAATASGVMPVFQNEPKRPRKTLPKLPQQLRKRWRMPASRSRRSN